MVAATSPIVRPVDYFGSSRMLERKGPPKRVEMPAKAHDAEVARRLAASAGSSLIWGLGPMRRRAKSRIGREI
jgi:hypothetical protein